MADQKWRKPTAKNSQGEYINEVVVLMNRDRVDKLESWFAACRKTKSRNEDHLLSPSKPGKSEHPRSAFLHFLTEVIASFPQVNIWALKDRFHTDSHWPWFTSSTGVGYRYTFTKLITDLSLYIVETLFTVQTPNPSDEAFRAATTSHTFKTETTASEKAAGHGETREIKVKLLTVAGLVSIINTKITACRRAKHSWQRIKNGEESAQNSAVPTMMSLATDPLDAVEMEAFDHTNQRGEEWSQLSSHRTSRDSSGSGSARRSSGSQGSRQSGSGSGRQSSGSKGSRQREINGISRSLSDSPPSEHVQSDDDNLAGMSKQPIDDGAGDNTDESDDEDTSASVNPFQ